MHSRHASDAACRQKMRQGSESLHKRFIRARKSSCTMKQTLAEQPVQPMLIDMHS